jgi:outer membrane receptor protein involved in Fe transport
VATVRASGPLIILPGGPATLTVAGEYRDEDSEDAINKAPDTTLVIPARSRTSKSGYAEIRAPIVGDRNAFSLMYALELEAALRYERYSTTVADPQSYDGLAPPPPITQLKTALHSTDFTTAVRWSPIEALSLRASYSTGFLPPEIDQLVPSLFTDEFGGILGYTDPLRGNELVGSAAPYDFISGGHAGLGPESSKSFSIGAIFETKFVSGFRLSLDFTRIHKTNEILETGSNGQFFIDNEEIFPDRIVRGAPLPGDPPGTPGPIIFIDAGPVNVSKAKVEAWDLQADYRIESQRFGSFHFYAIGTYEPEFRRQLIPTSPEYQTAGYTNGVVRWKGNGGLDWSLGGLSIGWNVQYYGSYSVRRNEPGGAALDDRAVQIEGRERIPRQIYHDLTVSYRFERAPGSALSGLELRAGVQNLFDHKPPVLANPTLLLGAFGDPRLRRYTFSLTKHFGR